MRSAASGTQLATREPEIVAGLPTRSVRAELGQRAGIWPDRTTLDRKAERPLGVVAIRPAVGVPQRDLAPAQAGSIELPDAAPAGLEGRSSMTVAPSAS
jgi:hypothetical protein